MKNADETISKTSGTVSHNYTFQYDMRSQLVDAYVTNIGTYSWVRDLYSYDKAGNVQTHTTNTSAGDGTPVQYTYTNGGYSDLMDTASGGDSFDLDWDDNGNLTLKNMATDTTLEYNWDNKLRSATKGTDLIALKYDPMGNRVLRTVNGVTRKYIVDVSGDLPVILMEIDPGSNLNNPADDTIAKTYIYGNGEILAQHDGSYAAAKYFYLHDRVGSVRQIIDTSGYVKNYYTYNPFGETIESGGTFANSFMFTGQYYDSEISEYYLRARQYDPHIARFTTRDPVFGQFEEPMTLHVYLYCSNDPINRMDPFGLLYTPAGGPDYDWITTQDVIRRANALVGTSFVEGPIEAFGLFGRGGEFDYGATTYTFQLTRNVNVKGSEFSNWLAGYTCYYNYGYAGEKGARGAGNLWSYLQHDRPDEPSSRYFISAGILKAMDERFAEGRRSLLSKWTFIKAKSELMRFGYDRILEGEFERNCRSISAEFGSDEWWSQLDMLVEFWNAGPSAQYW